MGGSNLCFIPCRYNSSRLPGKPLLKINNKTIIRLVYEQVKKARTIDQIIVLTDDSRIKEEVDSFAPHGTCFMTGNASNGTERIVNFIKKAWNKFPYDTIVNVQGDEPFINPKNIDLCVENYWNKKDKIVDMKCSTLHYIYNNFDDIFHRSNGKLVLDKSNNILYASRNIIPGLKRKPYDKKLTYYGHIGVFVFDAIYLVDEYLNGKTPYQLSEDIEWLKILEDGYKINSVLVDEESHERGVDVQDDYDYLKNKYQD